MGTNYYAESKPCEHCGRGDGRSVHICKSLISFQGYSDEYGTPPWGPIRSWADWRRVLVDHGLTVRDEYGRTHDVADFIAQVEATDPDARSRQYRWMVEHYDDGGAADWLDPDGFSFTIVDFS